jgi:hypothetical protein
VKKIIGISIAMGVILGGCSEKEEFIKIHHPGEEGFHSDIAPLSEVHMVPSQRAIAYKGVYFSSISHTIRYAMDFSTYYEKFKKIRLVMVDYTVLPHEAAEKKAYKKKFKGQGYFSKYKNKPQRYYMTISFYECDNTPPLPPFFEGTASMSVEKAPPHEALTLMADEIIQSYLNSPYSKVKVNLD